MLSDHSDKKTFESTAVTGDTKMVFTADVAVTITAGWALSDILCTLQCQVALKPTSLQGAGLAMVFISCSFIASMELTLLLLLY